MFTWWYWDNSNLWLFIWCIFKTNQEGILSELMKHIHGFLFVWVSFVCSHDFIGEFTTSYRELSRGQNQFNVYEVRPDMGVFCCCSAFPSYQDLVRRNLQDVVIVTSAGSAWADKCSVTLGKLTQPFLNTETETLKQRWYTAH